MPACILFDFNPRTSIRGATYYCLLHWDRVRYFNPRTLRGVRRYTTTMAAQFVEFQSTHPSWGATVDFLVNLFFCDSISIHAPIVGCDVVCNKADITLTIISIHAPIVGCDFKIFRRPRNVAISIHAPIVGCDSIKRRGYQGNTYFNPRTHRGVRRSAIYEPIQRTVISIHAPIVGCDEEMVNLSYLLCEFQSTHPSWGATTCVVVVCVPFTISIHAPIVGCDPTLSTHILYCRYFSPRTHRGVRLGAGLSGSVIARISIHAPIVGCDIIIQVVTVHQAISIHAPIVGCDP